MNFDVQYVHTEEGLRDALNRLHEKNGWRDIAKMQPFRRYKIPFGTLSAIAGGADVPKKWLEVLGLPRRKMVDVCLVHGVVHDYDCQKQVVKAKREKKEPKQKDRYPRFTAYWFEQTKGW